MKIPQAEMQTCEHTLCIRLCIEQIVETINNKLVLIDFIKEEEHSWDTQYSPFFKAEHLAKIWCLRVKNVIKQFYPILNHSSNLTQVI